MLNIVSGLIGQGLQSSAQRKAQDRQNAANMEMAKYSYSKDLEQWNRTNAYNDPSQQMARLKAAGINPNSIYGTSSATGNAGSTTAKYNTPTQQYKANVDYPAMLSQISQLRKTNAETNLINQNASQKGQLFSDQLAGLGYDTEKKYMEHLYRMSDGLKGLPNQNYFKRMANEDNILKNRSRLANQGQTFSDNILAKLQGKILQKALDNIPGAAGLFGFNR